MSAQVDPKDALVDSLRVIIRQEMGNHEQAKTPISTRAVLSLMALAVCISLASSFLFSSEEVSKKVEFFWRVAVGIAGGVAVSAAEKVKGWLVRMVSKTPVAVGIYCVFVITIAAWIAQYVPFRIFPAFPEVTPSENIEVSVDGGNKTSFDRSRGVVVKGIRRVHLEASYTTQDKALTRPAKKELGLSTVLRAALNRAPVIGHIVSAPRIELWPLFALDAMVMNTRNVREIEFERDFGNADLMDDIRNNNSGVTITPLQKTKYRFHRNIVAAAGRIYLPAGCYQLLTPTQQVFRVQAGQTASSVNVDNKEKELKCD
jgi:hypothetical protein